VEIDIIFVIGQLKRELGNARNGFDYLKETSYDDALNFNGSNIDEFAEAFACFFVH
jgi:hypothetical protein